MELLIWFARNRRRGEDTSSCVLTMSSIPQVISGMQGSAPGGFMAIKVGISISLPEPERLVTGPLIYLCPAGKGAIRAAEVGVNRL